MKVRTVIERHLDAVRSGNPAGIVQDYADDAVLVRGDHTYRGRQEIEAYFSTVAPRLGEGRVEASVVATRAELATFEWCIVGGPADGVAGRDTCVVRGGQIVSQRVTLHRGDF